MRETLLLDMPRRQVVLTIPKALSSRSPLWRPTGGPTPALSA